MQKIVIKNFGPIEKVSLETRDILIFIGPQASGKSTVSRAVYFFKSLKDDLTSYVIELMRQKEFEKPLGGFSKRIKAKFLDFWGPSHHLEKIYLRYEYDKDVFITILPRGKYANPNFSPSFKEKFFEIIEEVKIFSEQIAQKDPRFLTSSDILSMESEKRAFLSSIRHLTDDLFSDSRDLIFIPAGRSLLATLSDRLQYIHPHRTDYLMQSFIDRINNSKSLFSKDLSDLITDKKKLTRENIDFSSLSVAMEIIGNILKGEYRYDSDGEKLYFKSDRYTKLNYASSGQQESIWILLLIFLIILNNNKVFIVFEEPEAHLYPEAQKEITDLICLISNLDNRIIITTHSPYILSSFNNLLYANIIGKKKPKDVHSVINKKLWANPDKIDAFFVSDGVLRSIIDRETGLIETEAIDSASETINRTFGRLFDLDDN